MATRYYKGNIPQHVLDHAKEVVEECFAEVDHRLHFYQEDGVTAVSALVWFGDDDCGLWLSAVEEGLEQGAFDLIETIFFHWWLAEDNPHSAPTPTWNWVEAGLYDLCRG